MAARFLLDTNICIYIRQLRPPHVLDRFKRLQPGDAVISVITYGELRYGAEKSRERQKAMLRLQELVTLMPVLDMPAEAGESYGAIRAQLEAKGEIIGNNDLWIAAHAKAAGLILVTSNEREFKRVPGLVVQNWAA